MPPLGLPDHDIFLTDDLYESKDPAQVLQCIVAFSRRANAVNPLAFPRAIGAKSKGSFVSPQLSGTNQGAYSRAPVGLSSRDRAQSNTSDSSPIVWNPLAKGSYSGRTSPTKGSGSMSPPGNVSSWSKKGDEGSTAPAWNIHQYGYMGGASQGNQGISFGARRQITSSTPPVPSLAEKERRRKEEEDKEAQRKRIEAEEAEQQRRLALEADEERARLEEEQRWREETRRLRQKEKEEAEEERRRAEEQLRRNEEEEARLRQERDQEPRRINERAQQREKGDARLRGQFLSQYQSQQGGAPQHISGAVTHSTSESQRIADLERQLELAKERERQYQLDRQERLRETQTTNNLSSEPKLSDSSSYQSGPQVPLKDKLDDDWQQSEREHLRREWNTHNDTDRQQRPIQAPASKGSLEGAHPVQTHMERDFSHPQPAPPRPLPDPSSYAQKSNRTDRYLSTNPVPSPILPQSHRPEGYSTTTEVDLENQHRKESQAKTKAGGWASKSLLEREMERERERQREWEEGQKQTAKASRDSQEGAGPGKSWDVHQYGYMGGDSQNRGGPGLGVGGARRQIIGPRPPP